MMDLGALICLPHSPDCASCPLAEDCLAYRRGVQKERPLRRARSGIPHVTQVSGVLRRGEHVLLGRRPEGKLLGGLWEFPGGMCDGDDTSETALRRELHEGLGVYVVPGHKVGRFKHAYTHYRVTALVFECRVAEGEPEPLRHTELRWVRVGNLAEFPMGKIDRAIARRIERRFWQGY